MLRLPHIVLLAAFVVLTLLSPLASAQPPKDVIDNRDFLKWQNRVNNLTSEIVSESSAVPDAERSLYLALLAKSWWKVDESEAREYLKKGADKLLSSVTFEDKTDRQRKFKLIQKAVKVIAGLDEKLGQSLVNKIEASIGNDEDSRKEDREMADLYAKLGLQVAQTNPPLAYALGMKSLKYGRSRDLPRLASELFAKDNKLGDMLFRQAFLVARESFSVENIQFVFDLSSFTFDTRPERIIPESLRRSFLEVYAYLLSRALETESERPKRCLIVFNAPSILPKFDEYLPAIALSVREQAQTCIPFTQSSVREYADSKINNEPPKTPEDSVLAARSANKEAAKVRYFMLAISQYAEAERFEEIIALLDGMSDDEVKMVGPELWDDRRIEYALQACRGYYKSKDLPAYYRMVNRTPKRIRSYVRFRMRDDISPIKDREFYLENAEDIWKDLKSLEIKPSIAASNYLALMNMYLNVQPTEADKIFRDAVKAINIVDSENSDYVAEKDYYSGMDVIPLAAEMLDIDEIGFTNSLAAISSRRSRVRLKLGLLEPSLKKYVEEKKRLDEKIKAKAIESQQQKARKP